MKISVTLPSLRPHLIERTLDNIASTRREHEVQVLVNDHEHGGNVRAHAEVFAFAKGDFVTAFVDDHTYIDGWDVLAVENFLRREKEFKGPGPFCLGLRQLPLDRIEQIGTVFGYYYPYFPFMRLADVPRIGGWYDGDLYRRGFADCDLGLRVWLNYGRCEWSDAALILVQPADSENSEGPPPAEDMQAFTDKWAPIYGTLEGVSYDLTHLRGFNQDYPVAAFGPERTCRRHSSL